MARRPSAWWKRRASVGGGLGLAILIGAAVLFWQPGTARPPLPADGKLPRLSEDPPATISNPGFLGPQACVACHADRVNEFRATRHFLANCLPESGRMPDGFAPGMGTYAVPDVPLRFEMTASESGFHQTAIRAAAEGEQSSTATIAFAYGAAGGNDEVYFAWHGDHLVELPMVWLAPLGTWGVPAFDRRAAGDYARDTTIRCVECHNTWFEHVTGSRNRYSHDNFILGVTCEVCHGPGREHVEFHEAHPDDREPHAIARPGRLARERQIDLCAQCHSNALKHRGPAFRYRPGERLEDYYLTLQTRHPEEDHVANQTTYLRQSRCFQASETLTCTTCHDPH